MKNVSTIAALCFLLLLLSCEADRSLIPNSHDGKVPEVTGFFYMLDSTTISKKKLIRLKWGYDTVRYNKSREEINLRDWEIFRAFNDTTFFQSRGRTFFSTFTDTTQDIQPGVRDSVIVLFKIIPSGYQSKVDNIQFTGRPSEILTIIVKKK